MKIIKLILVISVASLLLACASDDALNQSDNNGSSQWDFDHQLQFNKTLTKANTYLLEITPNKRVHFQKISAFLLRKSFHICRGYGFKLEVLQGIETFDHKRSFPNMISERFQAVVECPVREK